MPHINGSSQLNYSVYQDRYQRTSDGWKFTERVYEVTFALRRRMWTGPSSEQEVGNCGMASWNDTVIENFRANDGVVGGPWEGKTLILLHSIGRRSGNEHVNPLVAAPDGEAYVVCGSLGGAPTDPLWVGNLEAASGPVTVELGADTVTADYQVVRPGEAEWDRLYGIWREYWPDAAEYEKKTDRKFPVVRLSIRE